MIKFASITNSEKQANIACSVQACRSCLKTDVKLYNLYEKQLGRILDEFTGIPIHRSNGLPNQICGICRHLINKFQDFRSKCQKALQNLQQLQKAKQLTSHHIKILDGEELSPNLKTTLTKVNYYLPPKKQLQISTFHVNLSNYKIDNITKFELIETPIQRNLNINPNIVNNINFDTDDDLDIKKEYDDNNTYNNNLNVNIKICSFNHEFLNEDDGIDNENDFIHNTDNYQEDNETKLFEHEDDTSIKHEPEEEISKLNKKKNNRKKKTERNKSKKPKLLAEPNNEIVNVKETKKIYVKYVKDKSKEDKRTECTAKDEVDIETDQDRKNALLFYNRHPSKKTTKTEINKRMDMLEKFSKTYNVEVKFLNKEEQKVELEERKHYYRNLPYICELCFRGYSIEDAYQSHMAVHDPSSGEHECHVCKIRCKSYRDKEKHVNATHLKRFRCKQCGVVTKSQSYAKAHFARHSGASYSCDQCGKRFTQQTNYLSHMRTAHGDRARHCPLCYDTFLGPLGLKVHIGIVHKQAVRCNSCGAQFDNGKALNKHLENSVDNVCEAGIRSCPMCGLNATTDKLIKKHYDELHRTELKCDQCGKSFPTKFKLSTHLNEHRKCDELTTAGGFICESCGKGNFKNLNQLRCHQRVHTGERPFKCSLCPKTFRINNLLKSHMRVHTDERRYKCPLCPKAFHQSAHRTAHLLTHTKERPYACSACPKRYTSATAAREHADTVHRGLPARRRDKKQQT